MRNFVWAGVAAAMFASAPAVAKEMHCNFNKDYAAKFNNMTFTQDGTTYKLVVKDIYEGLPESIHTKDYNGFVNVKWGWEDPDKTKTNVMVRPRKSSECLNGIYDEKGKKLWGGAWCNTDKHKETGKDYDMTPLDGTNDTIYVTGGAASTTSKVNQLMAFFAKKSSSKFNQIGGCVEDK